MAPVGSLVHSMMYGDDDLVRDAFILKVLSPAVCQFWTFCCSYQPDDSSVAASYGIKSTSVPMTGVVMPTVPSLDLIFTR